MYCCASSARCSRLTHGDFSCLRVVAPRDIAQRIEGAATRLGQRDRGIGSKRETLHPAVPFVHDRPRFHAGCRDAQREVWLIFIEDLDAFRSSLEGFHFFCVEMYLPMGFPFRLRFKEQLEIQLRIISGAPLGQPADEMW